MNIRDVVFLGVVAWLVMQFGLKPMGWHFEFKRADPQNAVVSQEEYAGVPGDPNDPMRPASHDNDQRTTTNTGHSTLVRETSRSTSKPSSGESAEENRQLPERRTDDLEFAIQEGWANKQIKATN